MWYLSLFYCYLIHKMDVATTLVMSLFIGSTIKVPLCQDNDLSASRECQKQGTNFKSSEFRWLIIKKIIRQLAKGQLSLCHSFLVCIGEGVRVTRMGKVKRGNSRARVIFAFFSKYISCKQNDCIKLYLYVYIHSMGPQVFSRKNLRTHTSLIHCNLSIITHRQYQNKQKNYCIKF